MAVSRRDAAFNELYLPARVGESQLIGTEAKNITDSINSHNSKNSIESSKNSTDVTKNSITGEDFDAKEGSIGGSIDGNMPTDHHLDHPQNSIESIIRSDEDNTSPVR